MIDSRAVRRGVFLAAFACAAASSLHGQDLRGTVEYKKQLARVLVARGLRQALTRLGGQA